jgi:hypothetical protein
LGDCWQRQPLCPETRNRELGEVQPAKFSDYGEPMGTEVFPENTASPNSLILWGFSRVCGEQERIVMMRGLNGGGCSLQRTGLFGFPLTGEKYREFSRFWFSCLSGNYLYRPCIQAIYCALIPSPACKEQGIQKWVTGNCIPCYPIATRYITGNPFKIPAQGFEPKIR